MLCPDCKAEVGEGAAFCGSCGAPLDQAVTEVAGQASADQAVYAQQMAEYERQKAAYDQQQYAAQQVAYEQQQAVYAAQTGQQTPPAKKSKAGCIIAVVIILVLLLVGCGVGGFFALKAFEDAADEAATAVSSEFGDSEGVSAGDGSTLDSYATADEAVQAQLDASGVGDWVYTVYDEGDGYATYWAGPPNSEYVDELYLEENADGTWSVIEVYSIGDDGFSEGGSLEAGNEAMLVVEEHLTYVMADMGLEAQSLTVDPFHSDSASAQVSGGGFDYYEVVGYTEQSDGTFWVETTQTWYGSTESWEYWVVPTEAGYRIADIRLM